MRLLTPQLHALLRANAITSLMCDGKGERFDPVPLVKLFNPASAATWIATELHEDCDTLFGLTDLGFGCPELGVFSLDEIASLQLPFGLAIERDLLFITDKPLSAWADMARRTGSILQAEFEFHRRAVTELPNPKDKGDG